MQDSLLKKERAAQLARDKLILELRLQNRAAETGSCGAIPASASTSSGLDSTFSWYQKLVMKIDDDQAQ